MLVRHATACMHVTKHIGSQFAISVKQEHIVPSAVDASVADVVEHAVGQALLPRLMGYL